MRARVATAVWGLCASAGCGRLDFDRHDATAGKRDGPLTDSAAPIDGNPPPATITLRQVDVTSIDGVETQLTATFEQAVAAGDLIIVMFDYDFDTARPTNVLSDTLGNTFAVAVPDGTEANYVQVMAYTFATSAGTDAVTLTTSLPTATFVELRVIDYAGAHALDTVADFHTVLNAAGTVAAPPLTTTADDELIVVAGVGHPGHITAGPGFTQRSTATMDVVEDLGAPTAGSYAITVTSVLATGHLTTSAAAFR